MKPNEEIAGTRSSFMNLPPELRDMVYRHLVISSWVFSLGSRERIFESSHLDGKERKGEERNVMFVSKLINHEAEAIFYAESWFEMVFIYISSISCDHSSSGGPLNLT